MSVPDQSRAKLTVRETPTTFDFPELHHSGSTDCARNP